jgi:hypothetical protein
MNKKRKPLCTFAFSYFNLQWQPTQHTSENAEEQAATGDGRRMQVWVLEQLRKSRTNADSRSAKG